MRELKEITISHIVYSHVWKRGDRGSEEKKMMVASTLAPSNTVHDFSRQTRKC